MASALNEEAQSETTSTSAADDRNFLTRDERDEVAKLLGIPEDEIVQEKFPVSRRRMEQLMFGHSEDAAFNFFDSIMKESQTVIIWPTRLKMNARSRKDPFIKVRGHIENIMIAKDRIIEGLHAEVKKVTLKIDVSYTDHSHLIGKGGNTIKVVMSSTACHIHFPDCNRSSQHEKSNMVSIAGEIENVEIARAKVRELVPLVFSFDLPVLGTIFMPMEEHSSFIESLKDQFNVQVFFRTKQKLNSTLVLVKGNGLDFDSVKEATEQLISHMKSNQVEQTQIYASIEISPHHHAIVRGKDNSNLNLIKSHTKTQVQSLLMPDYQRRIEFCEWYLNQFPHRRDHVLWTDEAMFTRKGIINLRNSHVWDYENPHATVEATYQHEFRVNMWVGIMRERVVGPFELPHRLNSAAFHEITFPDLQDYNLPSMKRSNVLITGRSIQSVYNALQYVIGSLPVILSFEVPESSADTSQLQEINARYDVLITAKPRSKGNVYTFTIKGVERNMANIYDAYKAILNDNDLQPVNVEVPPSYMLPGALPFNSSITSCTLDSDQSRSPSSYSALSPITLGHISPVPQLPTSTTRIHHHHHHHPGHNHHSQNNRSFLIDGYVPIPPGYPPQCSNPAYSLWTNPLHINPVHERELGMQTLSVPSPREPKNFSMSVPSTGPSPIPSPRTQSPTNRTPSPTNSIALSYGYNGFQFDSQNGLTSRPTPRDTPVASPRVSSPTNHLSTYGENGSSFNRPHSSLSPSDIASAFGLDNLRTSIVQLKRQRPKPSELRIPTPTWSGCGFSMSGPSSTLRDMKRACKSCDGEEWRTLTSSSSSEPTDSQPLSNILDVVGSSVVETVSTLPDSGDIQTLLASVGLEKYFRNFVDHEATDLDVFTSLHEKDLMGIGINALGARKKLLMLIAELKYRLQDFRATPGAERKRLPKEIWWPEPN